MTTGKRTKKSDAAKDAAAPEKEAKAPAAKTGGTKEAKPKKAAAPAKKDAKKPADAKAKPKKAASGDDDLADMAEDLGDEEFGDEDFDLDDLEGEPGAAPASKRAAAAGGKGKAPAKRAAAPTSDDGDDFDGDDDEDDDDEDEEGEARPKPAAAAKPKAPAKRPGEGEGEGAPPAFVPARRITPEAKAKLNELLAKGVKLDEALRQVAQWETFVAPVREAQPAMDHRMRPAHRPKEAEREPTIDDLDTIPEEDVEEGIE